jgi:hypothetical protein
MTNFGRQGSYVEAMRLLDDGCTPRTMLRLARNAKKAFGPEEAALALRNALRMPMRDAEKLIEVAAAAQEAGVSDQDFE